MTTRSELTGRMATPPREAPWGHHMVLDLGRCRPEVATDPDALRRFVTTLVDAIRMTAYGEPMVVHFGEHDPELAGWTVVQLIETSNIMAHFMDGSGDAYLDVFSCQEFDPEVVLAVVAQMLAPERVTTRMLARRA